MDWEGFVDIGFIKCGQNSVVQYFYDKYKMPYKMERNEFIANKMGEKLYVDKYHKEKKRAVICIRDPVDRIWSAYHYFDTYNKKMSFEEYLFYVGCNDSFGEENPVMMSNYDKWIYRFKKYDPLIIKLEDIRKEEGFPHKNKTSEKNSKYEKMPQYLRSMVADLVEKEREKYKTPTWSVDVGISHLK